MEIGCTPTRNVSQIIANSNGQVGGSGPGPVVLSARCRACRTMKSIKAPAFEGRNRSPNPSFAPCCVPAAPFSSCLSPGRNAASRSLVNGAGTKKGVIHSQFSNQGNFRTSPVFLSFFFFFFSFFLTDFVLFSLSLFFLLLLLEASCIEKSNFDRSSSFSCSRSFFVSRRSTEILLHLLISSVSIFRERWAPSEKNAITFFKLHFPSPAIRRSFFRFVRRLYWSLVKKQREQLQYILIVSALSNFFFPLAGKRAGAIATASSSFLFFPSPRLLPPPLL